MSARGIGCLLLAGVAGCRPSERPADLVVTNARVWTGDSARPEAEALAVREGRLVRVGTAADVRALTGPSTQRVDAQGRRLVPGFNDAHWHLPTRRTADLNDARSATTLLYTQEQRGDDEVVVCDSFVLVDYKCLGRTRDDALAATAGYAGQVWTHAERSSR